MSLRTDMQPKTERSSQCCLEWPTSLPGRQDKVSVIFKTPTGEEQISLHHLPYVLRELPKSDDNNYCTEITAPQGQRPRQPFHRANCQASAK
jgi:hypothetical protein